MKWYNNFSLCFHLNQVACCLPSTVLKYLKPTTESSPVLPNRTIPLSLESATKFKSLGSSEGTHLLASCTY